MTTRDLLNGAAGEMEGDIVVRKYNSEREDYDVESDLRNIETSDPILDCDIRCIYASMNPNRDTEQPALIIEIGDEE